MWAGEKVHDCIKHTLINLQRGISVLDVDEIVSITLTKMRDDFRSSRDRRYLVYAKACALFEHEYGVDLLGAQWKRVADDVENNVPKKERFFKKIEEDRIRDRCNFRKVCESAPPR